jgi:hypothetical protein
MGSLKGFPRIMEKTQEYIREQQLTSWKERVLAPLFVIDILRATVEVTCLQRSIEVESALRSKMPLARGKNGHSKDLSVVIGGYRDQKFNLVLDVQDAAIGHISLLVEVQILLLPYVKGMSLSLSLLFLSSLVRCTVTSSCL